MARVRPRVAAPAGMPERLTRFVLEEWAEPERLAGSDPRRVVAYFAVGDYLAARQHWFEGQGLRPVADDSWKGAF